MLAAFGSVVAVFHHRQKAEVDPILSMATVSQDGWAFFRALLEKSSSYLEFGSGESTLLADKTGIARVTSIETDSAWVERLQGMVSNRTTVHYINLGPVGRWGRPISYEYRDSFLDYCEAPFSGNANPDLVLVDGRFRVAAFLTALLRTEPGTQIVFDDYVSRPEYHIVEIVLRPYKIGTRQAYFQVPADLNIGDIETLRDRFLYVMD